MSFDYKLSVQLQVACCVLLTLLLTECDVKLNSEMEAEI